MKKNRELVRAAVGSLLAAGLLAAAGGVAARNDKLLLPLQPALRGGGLVAAPTAEVPLQFGGATAASGDNVLGTVEAHGVVFPSEGGNNNNGGKPERRSDQEACNDALRRALVELQKRARALGGVAVVGVVGNYHGVVFDSPEQYECHVGFTRAVVDLRGQAVRAVPATASK